MKHSSQSFGFTLIEVLVSMTILAIIMVSIISIFYSSSQVSLKIDINRSLQENIKNITETIAEDIRNSGINTCSVGSNCHILTPGKNYTHATQLWSGTHRYYLGTQDSSGNWIITWATQCQNLTTQCHLVIAKDGGVYPLSNTQVDITSADFWITTDAIPKVTISLNLRPNMKQWISPTLLKESEMMFQTTISERLIDNL